MSKLACIKHNADAESKNAACDTPSGSTFREIVDERQFWKQLCFLS